MSIEDIAGMEQEMEALQHDLKATEESYGEIMLNLTQAGEHLVLLGILSRPQARCGAPTTSTHAQAIYSLRS